MKRYLKTLHTRPVHEKREFAIHAAAGVTALIGLIWVSTLGVRLAAGTAQTTMAEGTDAASLVAATAEAGQAFQSQMQAPGDTASQTSGSTVTVDQGSGDTTTDASGQTTETDQSGNASAPQATPATVIGSPNDPSTAITQ